MWRVALRLRWIAALILALGVAAAFAALGQWQLDRSVEQATVIERDTESVVPLESLAVPQSTITTQASGRTVSVACRFVEGDDVVVVERQSPSGSGSWLVRHCRTPEGDSLVVAAGWLGEAAFVDSDPGREREVTGRYVPSESPQQSDFHDGKRQAVAVSEILNLWSEPGPVYGGYLVLEDVPAGLTTIVTAVPDIDAKLNWLNLFYAAEWVIFALFALYLWYRLVRDAWERELEEASSDVP